MGTPLPLPYPQRVSSPRGLGSRLLSQAELPRDPKPRQEKAGFTPRASRKVPTSAESQGDELAHTPSCHLVVNEKNARLKDLC